MRFSQTEITDIAKPNGFDEGMVEKVLHLMYLLDVLNSHLSLRDKWALKGSSALNLFIFHRTNLICKDYVYQKNKK